jgi:hypothetical protein
LGFLRETFSTRLPDSLPAYIGERMDNRTLALHLSTQERIPNDLLKAVHAALLAELPRERVLEFWLRHPLILFKWPLPPKAFLRYLWQSDGKLPPEYFWSVIEDLAGFLERQGKRPERFFQLLNHGPGGGPPLDPHQAIRDMDVPEADASPADPRAWLLPGLPALARRMLPGCRMDPIPHRPDPARALCRSQSRLFVFQPLAKTRNVAVPDFRLFPGRLFLALPRLFGCAAFDRLEVAADMRGPAGCLGDADGKNWNWKGEVLRHRNARMGRVEPLEETFAAWPEADDLRDALGGLARTLVLRMERDFRPAGAKETLLRAGCAYGSPVILARIGFAPNRRWGGLTALLRRIPPPLPEPRPPWEVAERLHRELIDSLD